jgi:GGDEF domain-containing protein
VDGAADDPQGYRDTGTGAHSRTGFLYLGEHELRQAARKGAPIVVIVLGVDAAESDPEGERWGLTALVESVQAVVRTTDIVGRWNERTLVVFPVDAPTGSDPIIQRIVSHLSGWADRLPASVRIRSTSARWDPLQPTALDELVDAAVNDLPDGTLLHPRY